MGGWRPTLFPSPPKLNTSNLSLVFTLGGHFSAPGGHFRETGVHFEFSWQCGVPDIEVVQEVSESPQRR